MTDALQPTFNIEKLYVKDLSVEVPNAPAIYLEREAPQMEVNMSTDSRAMGEDMYHTS
ncbi:MAG: protein-export chaperone SecB, partial [Thiobacillus sp.]|nr:protein-export chaperone SecB [Thiobacillus sp.]